MRKTLQLLSIALILPACAVACVGPDEAYPSSVTSESVHQVPVVVAHRAGTMDYPENTLVGIAGSLRDGADAIWLSVQLSGDGVPVLYRPRDLAALTDGSGQVAEKSADELAQLNAGWMFTPPGDATTPYRDEPTPIPTLIEALEAVPTEMTVFLDLKQTPALPLVAAVDRVLESSGDAARVILYSTDSETTALASAGTQAVVAESRDATRKRLLDVALAHRCASAPPAGTWVAFEFHRSITITETVTLGTAETSAEADLWDAESMKCVDPDGSVNTMAIGVNTQDDYEQAAKLGIDAVLVDSPSLARSWRTATQ